MISKGYLLTIIIFCCIFSIDNLVHSDPTTPVYQYEFQDAVTGDNEFIGNDGKTRWDVDPGADDYQNEVYERPTIQTYDNNEGNDSFSSQEYYQNIDIVQAKFGYDNTYIYGLVDLYGTGKTDQGGTSFEGLKYEYGFRFALDADGRNGFLFRSDDPVSKNGTSYGLQGNSIFKDTDQDVGGRGIHNGGPTGIGVTKSDNPGEEAGLNGYDDDIVEDGKLLPDKNTDVFFSRINPDDSSIVEFAVEYGQLGLTIDDILSIGYLDFQAIKGDPTDPANYFWNDKYTKLEAGSPYNLAEFGAEDGVGGLGNVYELDTLRAGEITPQVEVPEPETYALLTMILVAMGFVAHRRKIIYHV